MFHVNQSADMGSYPATARGPTERALLGVYPRTRVLQRIAGSGGTVTELRNLGLLWLREFDEWCARAACAVIEEAGLTDKEGDAVRQVFCELYGVAERWMRDCGVLASAPA